MDTESKIELITCKAPDWCDTSSTAGGHETEGADLSDIGSPDAIGARPIENEWTECRPVVGASARCDDGNVVDNDGTYAHTVRIAGRGIRFGPLVSRERPACDLDVEAEVVAAALAGRGNLRVVALTMGVLAGIEEGVLTPDDVPAIELVVGEPDQLAYPVSVGGRHVNQVNNRGRRLNNDAILRARADFDRAIELVQAYPRVWIWMMGWEPVLRPSVRGYFEDSADVIRARCFERARDFATAERSNRNGWCPCESGKKYKRCHAR